MLAYGDMHFTSAKERQFLLQHSAKNAFYEQDKAQIEREHLQNYKMSLIEDIMKFSNNFTYEELAKKTTRTLERIYDNC